MLRFSAVATVDAIAFFSSNNVNRENLINFCEPNTHFPRQTAIGLLSVTERREKNDNARK